MSLSGKAFSMVALLAVMAGIQSLPTNAAAEDLTWRYAVTSTGLPPKYKQDFAHFDYVNPTAPKGGSISLSSQDGFDSFNPILDKGEIADGLNNVFEPLMYSSPDEIAGSYGLLAEAVAFPDDISYAKFRLNPAAKWADGEPVTPEDVVFSFEKAKELNPQYQFYYLHVTKAEKTGDREVTFTFDEKNNKELPNIVGELMILPKHWWEGKDASGNQRDIGKTTLEPIMGSGPYKIVEVKPGDHVTFERRDDYWGKDLPVNVGRFNFKSMRYTYYRDRDVEFQAFKGGDIDLWQENRAKRWATEYDFPAFKDGRVLREEFPNEYRATGVMVGFVPNMRREQFKDARIREALNYAFDFEDLSRTIFFNAYKRIDSYFFGTELASKGLPEGKELEILNGLKDKVPASVFTTPYTNPVNGSQDNLRKNLRQALALFRQAGYELKNGKMVNSATGKPFTFEILLNGPIIEVVALPYVKNLKMIGIDATVRSVDSSQFINRMRTRDYDVVYQSWSETLRPGNEQSEYWSSASADREGSKNYAGIKDPAIDALIQKVIYAPDRDALVAAVHALDRVLLANHYVVPSYASSVSRVAYWKKVHPPETLPYYGLGFADTWWADAN